MSTQTAASEFDPPAGTTVYVYDAAVRLWHWINAAAIVVLATTGWFIARPLPSVNGEASAHFMTGYIRFTHFAAGYILAVGFLVRLLWVFIGNEHARQMFTLPATNGHWWQGVWRQVRWYGFADRKAPKYVAHNPLAHLMMFVFLLLLVFMLLTGFALYSEGKGVGSWQDHLFGWVIPAFGGSQAVHSWHHLGMWAITCFVLLHVYAAIREEIMSRQSMLSAIISGQRTYRP